MPETKDPALVTLGDKINPVRLSFPHLFTAHAMKDAAGKEQEPKFSATFLLDNIKHGALLDRIDQLADRLCLDEFKKARGGWLKYCLRDGNEKSDLEGYGDGTSFITASNKARPPVVDRQLNPIAEADDIIYAGCFVIATVRLWVQNNGWGKRINAQLRAVQFVKDGDSFGVGKVDPNQEFEAFDSDDATGAPVGSNTRSRSSGRSAGGGTPSKNLDDY
jgi:hypothetical protein